MELKNEENGEIPIEFFAKTREKTRVNPLFKALGCFNCARMNLHAKRGNKPVSKAIIDDNFIHPVVIERGADGTSLLLHCEHLDRWNTSPELRCEPTPCQTKTKVKVEI